MTIHTINKIIKLSSNICFFISITCLVLLVLLNAIEIFTRLVLDYSFMGVQEISLLLVCWVIFMGFTRVVIKKEDISVTFLVKKIKAKKLVKVINHILLLVPSCFVIFLGVGLTLQEMNFTTSIMGLPKGLYILPLPLAFVVITVFLFNELIKMAGGEKV
ncbi:TRAP transporter small permease [Gracilibacillus xinjiangensis]|uniref:TRAP transporter small permease n=1 Tax=Gracilibacillus xinjiangensis TaxID=1193282 RepID=A0ABV8WSY2_9BACI